MVVVKRHLPKEFNTLLDEEKWPYDKLVELRRLGQTNLTLSTPGQTATLPPRLGIFSYAHLRAPLPSNLQGSEIFPAEPPASYFLMRRSEDGCISATGMFKASFPWATKAQEEAERVYLRGFSTTSRDETAGNIWIPPQQALELAQDYHILPWIKALLDNQPIQAADGMPSITPPPPFSPITAKHFTPITPGTTGRGRGVRSISPSKSASPTKKTASPRKRANKATSAAGQALRNAVGNSAAHEQQTPKLSKSAAASDATATVSVDTAVETNGDTEIKHTHIKVEMPANSPDLPLPESTEEMIAQAKELVAEANKLDRGETNGVVSSKKRKAADLEEDEGENGEGSNPTKRAKTLEDALKNERVKNKALFGLAVTLAFGAALPYFL